MNDETESIETQHRFQKLTIWWNSKGAETEIVLYHKTYNEAIAIAKNFGFEETRWYKPWTWIRDTGMVTVG